MLGIIGGSGLTALPDVHVLDVLHPQTPYGRPSAELIKGEWEGQTVVFLARHGQDHQLPPHQINYRANIYALKQAGVNDILAVNAVGGINFAMAATDIVIPHQIIDYTWGREHSFSDYGHVLHVDFTEPYSASLRELLLQAAHVEEIVCVNGGVYGCTQGPRLETAAEIGRCVRDGCDLVGMTAMPEAILARELEIEYASLCLVVNWGAGLSPEPITMDAIAEIASAGEEKVQRLLRVAMDLLGGGPSGGKS